MAFLQNLLQQEHWKEDNMAYFAKLNSDNVVIDCLVFDDNDIINHGGHLSVEASKWVKNKFGKDFNWIEGSSDGSFRGQRIEIGGQYSESEDIFKRLKYFPSWVWNSELVDWISPIGVKPTKINYPVNTAFVKWNEPELTWYAYTINQAEDVVTNTNNQITSVNTKEIMQWYSWNNSNLSWNPAGDPITKTYVF